MKMQTSQPAAKVNAATLAAAITSIVLYLLHHYDIAGASSFPDVVEGGIGVLITAAITFAAGYFQPPAAQDRVVPDTAPPAPPAGIP